MGARYSEMTNARPLTTIVMMCCVSSIWASIPPGCAPRAWAGLFAAHSMAKAERREPIVVARQSFADARTEATMLGYVFICASKVRTCQDLSVRKRSEISRRVLSCRSLEVIQRRVT